MIYKQKFPSFLSTKVLLDIKKECLYNVMAKKNRTNNHGNLYLIGLSWPKQLRTSVPVSKRINPLIQMNCGEVQSCVHVSAEKKINLLHYHWDHCSSGIMINTDFQIPVSVCFKSYKRQSWLKHYILEYHSQRQHEIQ